MTEPPAGIGVVSRFLGTFDVAAARNGAPAALRSQIWVGPTFCLDLVGLVTVSVTTP